MLKELQKLRTDYSADPRLYWAITITIDYVLGMSKEDTERNMERLKRAIGKAQWKP
jgi:hypothetical protein